MTIIDYLISNHQADIDRINGREMTPLLLAVKNGMWSSVEYLLDHQASIEHCDKQKRTCLIIAASEGHLAVIDSLLEKGFLFIRMLKDIFFDRCETGFFFFSQVQMFIMKMKKVSPPYRGHV